MGDESVANALDRLNVRFDNREILHRIDKAVLELGGKVEASNTLLGGVAKTVYGNGVPGLKTDVDRLVQVAAAREWERRALWAAVLTALVGEIIVLLNTFVLNVK